MELEDLVGLNRRALSDLIGRGHPIDPTALDDTEYDGLSLAQPRIVQRLTWLKFKKVFHRDSSTGRLRGWNVKVRQTPLDQPWEAVERNGTPVTYWFYEVIDAAPYRMPRGWGRGLCIDYRLGRNALTEPTNFVRDPLVAVNEGSADLLLGVSFVHLGPLRIPTPSYFALRRGVPLSHVATPRRGR